MCDERLEERASSRAPPPPRLCRYRLFNEIGVRHLPVLNESYQLVGIATRKDVRIHNLTGAIAKALKTAPACPPRPTDGCGAGIDDALVRSTTVGSRENSAAGGADVDRQESRNSWRWSGAGPGHDVWGNGLPSDEHKSFPLSLPFPLRMVKSRKNAGPKPGRVPSKKASLGDVRV